MSIDEARNMGLGEQMARKIAFMTASDAKSACEVAWSKHVPEERKREYYFHYTTLPYLMANILNGKWYLKRSTSQRFNDLQETKKFGNAERAAHTYQLSFGKGVRESAALWGLRVGHGIGWRGGQSGRREVCRGVWRWRFDGGCTRCEERDMVIEGCDAFVVD